MGQGLERRFFPLELRAVDGEEEDGTPKIEGYAAVFNSLSVEMWGFRERIAPGAFTETLENDDIRSLWNHNSDFVLGRVKSGTLALEEDDEGLRFEVQPPDTQWGRDALTSVRRGDVDQASFMFRTLKHDWSIDENEQLIRTLLKVKLYEVSPVTFPAYPATQVSARGLELYGEKPEIPAEVQRALASAAGPDLAQVRRDLMRRRIRLLELD